LRKIQEWTLQAVFSTQSDALVHVFATPIGNLAQEKIMLGRDVEHLQKKENIWHEPLSVRI